MVRQTASITGDTKLNRVGTSVAGGLRGKKRCRRAGSMVKKSTGPRVADMMIASRGRNAVVTEDMSTEVVTQTEGIGMVETEGGSTVKRVVGTEKTNIGPA